MPSRHTLSMFYMNSLLYIKKASYFYMITYEVISSGLDSSQRLLLDMDSRFYPLSKNQKL